MNNLKNDIIDFVDKFYPKGMKERGFALLVMAQWYSFMKDKKHLRNCKEQETHTECYTGSVWTNKEG